MRGALAGMAAAVVAVACLRVYLPGMLEKDMNVVLEHDPWPVSTAGAELHDDLFVADLHSDSLLWDRDLNQHGDRGHVDFPRLRAGNVALQVFPAVTKSPSGQNYESNQSDAFDNITPLVMTQAWPMATWNSLTARALHQADRLRGFISESASPVMLIGSVDDLNELKNRRDAGEPVIGALLAIEGAHALEGELDNVERLYAAGYRMIGLQHFFDNKLGGSLHGSSKQGLTLFGKQVVARLLSLGIAVDLAHSSEQVVEDVLDLVDAPILVSHTGTHGHCASARNIRDELMQRIAAHGGVIGIGFWDDAICDASPEGIARQVIAAIDLVGEDAVALGSDYDGTITAHFDVSELPALTTALLNAGLTETQIRKVMGENVVSFLQRALASREHEQRNLRDLVAGTFQR